MLQGSVLYCMNAFMEPLCEVHGWTRAGLNLSMGFAALMGQLAMPLAAAISARCSLRRLMALVQETVLRETGVALEPEVRLLGF